MKHRISVIAISIIAVTALGWLYHQHTSTLNTALAASSTPDTNSSTINLAVPYTSEIPDGVWLKPWNNACEEASLVMVDQYYLHNKEKNLGKEEAKNLMRPVFAWEDANLGHNADTTAEETAQIINNYSSYYATVVKNPTINMIKKELDNGHPVIIPEYGYGLHNPHHRFRKGGSSYHMLVIKGYDDSTGEFITNDSGTDKFSGLDYRYKYATIMDNLHDLVRSTHQVNGTPVAIFTTPKSLLRAKGSSRVYLIDGDTKRYITSPKVFGDHNLHWNMIQTVEPAILNKYKRGTDLSQ